MGMKYQIQIFGTIEEVKKKRLANCQSQNEKNMLNVSTQTSIYIFL